jgi:hypothetical protein
MERSAHGFAMSQFDKDDVAALGLLKLDVLGVRMLSAMRHCLQLVNGTADHPPPASPTPACPAGTSRAAQPRCTCPPGDRPPTR